MNDELNSPINQEPVNGSPSLTRWKRFVWLGLGGLLLIVVLGVIFFLVRSGRQSLRMPGVGPSSITPPGTSMATGSVALPTTNDQDHDGVRDTDEAALGTSTGDFDTDHDGLADFDEINTWKTDPKKEDTDGDGHGDAIEILNGYNPLGAGKLP